MDFDQIYAIVISSIFIPLITWGMTKLFSLLEAKTEQVKNVKLQEALKNARVELEESVYLAVSEVQKTFVEALKADGKFTEEEAKVAFNKAVERTKQIMSAAGQAILMQAAVDINALITAEIEANLLVMQQTEGTLPVGPEV